MKSILCLYISVFLLISCQPTTNQQNVEVDSVNINSQFILPQIPSLLTNQSDRTEYLLTHYWDHYDFLNNDLIENKDLSEQAFVDFINLFNQVPAQSVTNAVDIMLTKAEENPLAFVYFKELYANYLYNPNSPMRNEVHYEAVLKYLISSKNTDDAARVKAELIYQLITKNKIGTTATDFSYANTAGKTNHLNKIKTPYTLVFFYEPGCSSCEASIGEMKDNVLLNSLIEDSQLTILAIYTLGDTKVWKDYQEKIPSNWINGNNGDQIRKDQLYDLKASPTMYLLDLNKKVILKDCYLQDVFIALQNK